MKTANIAAAKNQFSRLIDQVRHGETILITDRNHPVARLQPLEPAAVGLAALQASGLLSPPEGPALNVDSFLAAARPIDGPHGLRDAVAAEREEGR